MGGGMENGSLWGTPQGLRVAAVQGWNPQEEIPFAARQKGSECGSFLLEEFLHRDTRRHPRRLR